MFDLPPDVIVFLAPGFLIAACLSALWAVMQPDRSERRFEKVPVMEVDRGQIVWPLESVGGVK